MMGTMRRSDVLAPANGHAAIRDRRRQCRADARHDDATQDVADRARADFLRSHAGRRVRPLRPLNGERLRPGRAAVTRVDALFDGGRVIDLILGLMAVEAIALAVLYYMTGRGIAPVRLWPNLFAGAFLMLALRASLTDRAALRSVHGWRWAWSATSRTSPCAGRAMLPAPDQAASRAAPTCAEICHHRLVRVGRVAAHEPAHCDPWALRSRNDSPRRTGGLRPGSAAPSPRAPRSNTRCSPRRAAQQECRNR